MSHRFTTAIIADSRGRGLENFVGIHPTPANHDYVIEIRPGKSLSQLLPVIFDTISLYNPDYLYCIVFAGLCGLTDKMSVNNTSILRYKSCYREEKVSNTIDTIQFLKDSYGDHINICTIIPADLTGYFKYLNKSKPVPEYLAAEQLALEADIITINKAIIALNSKEITNINLSSRAQVKSKKRRQRSGSKVVYRRIAKFSYNELPDGVHFSAKLKSVTFGLIVNTAIQDITNSLWKEKDSQP